MIAILIATICFFSLVIPALAVDAPGQISPSNNSTTSTTTLTWQAPNYSLYQTSPYRIQVDDDQSFSSIDKDYYTSNTQYSPSLNENIWYWRVKAKDSSGTWSDWSSVWNFNFSLSSTSPTPSPIPTSNPTPSTATTPSPSPSPSNVFEIANLPSKIDSNQTFTASIYLKLPNSTNQKFYLKGAFKKESSTNYFGLTKSSGNWIKNGESYNEQLAVETDLQGEWKGNLELMPDTQDSGYQGSNDYSFKVAYYHNDGKGPNWSNQINIYINHQNVTTAATNTPTPIPSTPLASATNSEEASVSALYEDEYGNKEATSTSHYLANIPSKSPEVAGINIKQASQAPQKNSFPSLLLIVFGMIFVISSGFWYLRFKKNQLQS